MPGAGGVRFAVADGDVAGEGFAERARVALAAFAGRPGFRRGRVGRSVDEPAEWVLVTEWEGVGAYRRALSAYEVKVGATRCSRRPATRPARTRCWWPSTARVRS